MDTQVAETPVSSGLPFFCGIAIVAAALKEAVDGIAHVAIKGGRSWH